MHPLLRLAPLLLLALSSACALDLAKLVPQGYVSDYANVIPGAQRLALERYAANLEQQTGAQIAIVTLPTLEGEPIEDVANTLYRRWGIGKKGKDEGLLLLLAVNDRRSRLEIGYGLEPILPDGASGDVLRQMRPALREAAYGDALSTAAHYLGSRIAQAKGVTLAEDPTPRPSRSRPEERPLPLWLLIGGGLLFLYLLATGNLGALWLLSSLFSGGGSRHHRGGGGGGFGGYDSGGGFGGFGGGDSGGGGASSDW
ncbi:MAG: TPM domain-containing protein [Acidobacteria bacterium]|nr:TPM domain-containing protein [Acidobacteriota bacterium]